MKKLFTLLIAFVILSMSLSVFSACDHTQPQEDTTTEEITTVPNALKNDTIPVTALSEMQIVYGSVNRSVVSAIESLALMMKSIYGVEVAVVNESEPATEYEILVGATNRTESAEYLSAFKLEDDYGYSMIGNKVVIGGGSSGALMDALNAFSADIVFTKKGGDEIFFSIDWTMNYIKEHPLEQIVLNGTAISEYKVVYPKGAESKLYELLAKQIAYKVLEYSGCEPVVCDDSTAYDGGYEILIGDTNRISETAAKVSLESYQGEMYAKDKLVVLRGDTLQGIASATKSFAEYMESAMDAGEKTVSISIGTSQVVSLDTELSVMSFNVWYTQISATRIARVAQNIIYAQPDVFGVQEDSSAWVSALDSYFEGLYTRVGQVDSGSNEYNAIYYSHDKFTLLESGSKWLSSTPDVQSKAEGTTSYRTMVYAVLQRKSDSKIFVFTNTHFDNVGGQKEQARVLVSIATSLSVKYDNCPIFMVGDYNQTCILCPGFSYMIEQGFLNTEYEAALVLNGEYTCGPALGEEINTICLTPDHCFVKGVDSSQMKLCWVFNQRINGQYPSDHFAIYFEYDF